MRLTAPGTTNLTSAALPPFSVIDNSPDEARMWVSVWKTRIFGRSMHQNLPAGLRRRNRAPVNPQPSPMSANRLARLHVLLLAENKTPNLSLTESPRREHHELRRPSWFSDNGPRRFVNGEFLKRHFFYTPLPEPGPIA